MGFNNWDGDHFITTSQASIRAYEEAGIKDPRKEISMMEVHDCFSITELVTYEDLHISERGEPCGTLWTVLRQKGRGGTVPGGRRPEVLRPSYRRFGTAHAL